MKQGWEIKSLGQVCDMYQPKTISTKEMIDGGAYPVFGANGIIGKYDKYNHEEPQLLITCRGATCGSVNISEPKSWINGNAMVVRPKDHSIDLKFLEYLFRGGIDLSKTITGAAQPQITRQTLSPVEITYPKSLPEQLRIAATLDEAFAAIAKAKANAEQNLKNAKELFESYLGVIFENRGEGWSEKTIQELVDEGTLYKPLDGNHGEMHPLKSDYVVSGVPFIMSRDMIGGNIDEKNCKFISEKQARSLRTGFSKTGDVLLSHKGTIGSVAILHTKREFVVLTPQITYYRIKDHNKFYNRFIYYYFLSPRFQRELNDIAQGGSTRAYIGITRQLALRLAIAPLKSQKALVAKLDSLSEKTRKLETIYQTKIKDLEELEKSILQKAFSGELKTVKV